MIQLYLICLHINNLRGLMRECNLQTHKNAKFIHGDGIWMYLRSVAMFWASVFSRNLFKRVHNEIHTIS